MKFAILVFAAAAGLIAASDRGEYFTTDAGPVTVALIHHAAMVLEGMNRVIYVDPTSNGNYKGLPKADLVLITNDQPDHLELQAINKYSRKTTATIAPQGPSAKLPHCTAVSNGETVHFGEIVIEAVPAYGPGHEKGQGNGYVITYPGLRVYISGDTGFYPEMKNLKNIDVAFFAVGSDTMPVEDAVKALQTIKPRIAYPYHYRDAKVEDLRKQLMVPGVDVRVRNWY
jgi:L-ascorbate metabolism protein UlaG (beta-lactamase superfamily)